jgi:ribose 5-phosphate isomerase B
VRAGQVCQTCPVRVYLGSDHAGFELKTRLIEWLTGAGHEPVDCGPESYARDDDYPPYVMAAAHAVINDPGSLGIVIGGSGNGEQIAANKLPGIRAAVAWTNETAQLSGEPRHARRLAEIQDYEKTNELPPRPV